MLRRPTIFLADDHSLFCELITESLDDRFDVVGSAHDGQTAVAEVARLKPDVVMLDVFMPLLNGLDAAMRIRESSPSTRIIFLTMCQDAGMANKALKVGALGFLVKTSAASELPEAIWSVLRGERHVTPSILEQMERGECEEGQSPQLTSREREVIQLLAEGRPMKQVADLLKVSTRTVAFHKYGVMRKLGLRSSAELVRLAVAEGLVA